MKFLASAVTLCLLFLTAALTPALAGVVTNTNDSGAGSLRGEVAAANPGDTITFDQAVTGSIVLTSGQIVIDKNLTINGRDATTLTIDGNGSSRIFTVDAGVTVSISRLTLENGSAGAFGGGAIRNSGTLILNGLILFNNRSLTGEPGGAIRNQGDLTIILSSITANTCAQAAGGGIENEGNLNVDRSVFQDNISGNGSTGTGGGIFSIGDTLVITNSTFHENLVNNPSGTGGGISVADGQATLFNVTFTKNKVIGTGSIANGGGFSSNNDGVSSLTNVTLSDNFANDAGSNIIAFNSGQMTITNTIVANADGAGDCAVQFGGVVNDGGNNIVEDNSCGFSGGSDPMLLALASNGGPTPTMALTFGSPAIDAGNDAACLPTDQRGQARVGAHCDIGAYEFVPSPGTLQFSAPTYQVSETGGSFQVTVTRTGGGDGEVSADFATSDGTATVGVDYDSVTQTITFADGDMGNQIVEIPILEDDQIDPDETVTLSLSNPQGGATLGTNAESTLTIIDEPFTQPPPSAEDCGNRIDDDADGDVDCNDSDCDSAAICQGIDGGDGDSGGCRLSQMPGNTGGSGLWAMLLGLATLGWGIRRVRS